MYILEPAASDGDARMRFEPSTFGLKEKNATSTPARRELLAFWPKVVFTQL